MQRLPAARFGAAGAHCTTPLPEASATANVSTSPPPFVLGTLARKPLNAACFLPFSPHPQEVQT